MMPSRGRGPEGGREGGRPASLPWLKPPAVASQDSTPVGILARDDPMLKEANNLLWKWWVGLGRRSWWCDKEQGRPKIHLLAHFAFASSPPSLLPPNPHDHHDVSRILAFPHTGRPA